DRKARRILVVAKIYFIKNKKFGLGADIHGVRNSREPQIAFRPDGDRTRIKAVAFFRDRIDEVRYQADRRFVRERIDPETARIGNEQHIRFVDRRPAAKARSVKAESVLKTIFGKLADRKCQMV